MEAADEQLTNEQFMCNYLEKRLHYDPHPASVPTTALLTSKPFDGGSGVRAPSWLLLLSASLSVCHSQRQMLITGGGWLGEQKCHVTETNAPRS